MDNYHLFFNLSVLALLVGYLCDFNRKQTIPTKFMEYRFRFFALRDKLARLCVNDVITQESVEFQFLIRLFNTYIKDLESCNIPTLLRRVVSLENDKEFRVKVQMLLERCYETEEVAELMYEFEKAVVELLYEGSFILKYLSPMVVVMDSLSRRVKNILDALNENRRREEVFARLSRPAVVAR